MSARGATESPTLALRTVAMPAFANPYNDIFGGWLMSQMDIAGGIVATRRAKGRVVTVAITAITFDRPVFIGDEVSCYAEIVKVGRSSMTVQIQAIARRGRTGEKVEVTKGSFTYVAVDSEGKSRLVEEPSSRRRKPLPTRHSDRMRR